MDGQGAAIECNGEGPDVWVWHTAWRCSNVSYNCNINTQTICTFKKHSIVMQIGRKPSIIISLIRIPALCWNSKLKVLVVDLKKVEKPLKSWKEMCENANYAKQRDREGFRVDNWKRTMYEKVLDVVESRVRFASKNLTPRRMHLNDFLIAKINRWCISFPNMYNMLWAKVECMAGKT